VAVHAEDREDVERAAEVLEKGGAQQLEWLDSEGRRVET
jgi:hypothetical protein